MSKLGPDKPRYPLACSIVAAGAACGDAGPTTDGGADTGCEAVETAYAAPDWVDVVLAGESANAWVTGATRAGDVDADGYGDILVGASGNSRVGRGYLVLGGPCLATGSLRDADAIFAGDEEHELAGYMVAAAGDVDADGYDDFLLGGLDHDDASGVAWLVPGGPEPVSGAPSALGVGYTGESPDDYAGVAAAGAGDLDGDGYDDIVVGAVGVDADAGAAYVVFGGPSPASRSLSSADATYTGEQDGDRASGCAGAGDVDADGFEDLLVTAWGADYAGRAYLVLDGSSPGSRSLAEADAVYRGEQSYDLAANVAGAGDTDADGYDDALVGAPGCSGCPESGGAVYLVLGGPTPASASLSDSDAKYSGEGDGAGSTLDWAGDIDGDGFDELLVAAPGGDEHGPGTGVAYVVFGSPTPMSGSLSDIGSPYRGDAQLGRVSSVGGAGDVDGDGLPEVAVGSSYWDDGTLSGEGAAFLLLDP